MKKKFIDPQHVERACAFFDKGQYGLVLAEFLNLKGRKTREVKFLIKKAQNAFDDFIMDMVKELIAKREFDRAQGMLCQIRAPWRFEDFSETKVAVDNIVDDGCVVAANRAFLARDFRVVEAMGMKINNPSRILQWQVGGKQAAQCAL